MAQELHELADQQAQSEEKDEAAVVQEDIGDLILSTIVKEGTESNPRYLLCGIEGQTTTEMASVKDFVTSTLLIDKGSEASRSRRPTDKPNYRESPRGNC